VRAGFYLGRKFLQTSVLIIYIHYYHTDN
jgi:hypothetical protein